MSGRELVILLLGLAIVAVVLRGLYVAINARRGQIKLAIDKNIPQDVDLESLELAELPGGGARVVTRSLEEVNRQNSALDVAETRSRSLNLNEAEGDAHIPVLMDAVELSETVTDLNADSGQHQHAGQPDEDSQSVAAFEDEQANEEEASEYAAEELDEPIEDELEEDFVSQFSHEPSIGENWDEQEAEAQAEPFESAELAEQTEYETGEPTSTEFGYDGEMADDDEVQSSVDPLSSVAPDYDDSESVAEASVSFSESPDDGGYEAEEMESQADIYEQEREEVLAEEEEPQSPVFDADSSAEEFSMTAGERIGGNPPAIGEANQSGLFDEIDDVEEEETAKPKAHRSLFSLFGRKSKSKLEPDSDEQESGLVITDPSADSSSDEPDDVLFQDEPAQLDIEEVGQATAEYDEPIMEEAYQAEEAEEVDEVIDELDQKRSASLEQEVVEQDDHADALEQSEVLVLNVTAKDGRVFTGDDLLQVLITQGLKFGDMNIFHKRLSKEHQGTVIFSVANMLNPGTFDLNNMEEFTTLGISFFLALPTPINNLDAFEQMLDVAQVIRDTLDGDLKDDHRNGMTGQTIEHYRQRIRDFELRRLKAVAARG